MAAVDKSCFDVDAETAAPATSQWASSYGTWLNVSGRTRGGKPAMIKSSSLLTRATVSIDV